MFERVRLARRLTVGNHIGSSVSEFKTSQVGLGSVRKSKSEQLHSPAAVTPPTSNYLFIRVVAERPLLPTGALARLPLSVKDSAQTQNGRITPASDRSH